jgi:hypothetical protein
MIDTARLKAGVDLRKLAERYTTLSGGNAKELNGPCPKCGGSKRFHVTRDTFFCRHCLPLQKGKLYDVIDFLMWREGVNYLEACRMLGANDLPAPTEKRQPEQRKPESEKRWDGPEWQSESRAMITAARKRLASPAGAAGREYLLSRGIRQETWEAWGLGYGPSTPFKNGGQWQRPMSINMPWEGNGTVKALQFRFPEPIPLLDDSGQPKLGSDRKPTIKRFHAKGGGERTLFGAHMVRPGERQTLVLCEGEMNAISIWQDCRECGIDAVSWGSQDNLSRSAPYMAALAGKYELVIVWADEPGYAKSALATIEASGVPVIALRSPVGPDGKDRDANDLMKLGLLSDILQVAIDQHNATATPPAPATQAGQPNDTMSFSTTSLETEMISVSSPHCEDLIANDTMSPTKNLSSDTNKVSDASSIWDAWKVNYEAFYAEATDELCRYYDQAATWTDAELAQRIRYALANAMDAMTEASHGDEAAMREALTQGRAAYLSALEAVAAPQREGSEAPTAPGETNDTMSFVSSGTLFDLPATDQGQHWAAGELVSAVGGAVWAAGRRRVRRG